MTYKKPTYFTRAFHEALIRATERSEVTEQFFGTASVSSLINQGPEQVYGDNFDRIESGLAIHGLASRASGKQSADSEPL